MGLAQNLPAYCPPQATITEDKLQSSVTPAGRPAMFIFPGVTHKWAKTDTVIIITDIMIIIILLKYYNRFAKIKQSCKKVR